MNANQELPSYWLKRYAPLIRPGGTVLDLACGSGRNARWLAGQGWPVIAVDRDSKALSNLTGVDSISPLQVDLEEGIWPFPGLQFDAIVVCRYLHRPLLSLLAKSLNPGGILIYETFMIGQERLGRPRNLEFLLLPDELLHAFCASLHTIAFEQGLIAEPTPTYLQRICARN